MEARRRVLIIEDNADLLHILEQLLSDDYDVVTARRGEDGVSRALSSQPDLVILDLQLPQMGGIEAGTWIKRELGAIPILVLTALGDREAEAVLATGCCDAFMTKPAPLAAIRAKVADLLAASSGVPG